MEQLEADEEEEEEKEGSTSLDVVTRCGDETDDTQHKTDAVWPRSLIRGVELSTMTTIAWWSSARAGDGNSAEVSARLRRIIWQLQVACFFYSIPATTTTNHNSSNSPTHLDPSRPWWRRGAKRNPNHREEFHSGLEPENQRGETLTLIA